MKTWPVAILVLALLAVTAPAWAQKPAANHVPKYDPATEVTLKGTVVEVTDRQ